MTVNPELDRQKEHYRTSTSFWTRRSQIADSLARWESYDAPGLPVIRGLTVFYSSRQAGAAHYCLYRAVVDREGSRFTDSQVLVDPGALDSLENPVIDRFSVSPDASMIAVQISCGGTETGTLSVLDTNTGRTKEVSGIRVRYASVVWLPDSSAFLVTGRCNDGTAQLFLCRVDRKVINADCVAIPEAGRTANARMEVGYSSGLRRWTLTIRQGLTGGTSLWTRASLRRTHRHTDWVLGWSSPAPDTLQVTDQGRLLIQTNRSGPSQIWSTAILADGTTDTRWRLDVPVEPGVALRAFADAGGGAVLTLRSRAGTGAVTIHHPDGSTTSPDLNLTGMNDITAVSIHRDRLASEIWIIASAPGTPPNLYRWDLPTGDTAAFTPHDSYHDSLKMVHQRLSAVMDDGAEVDLLVSSRAEDLDHLLRPITPRPLILTCYGGFGVSSGPSYEPSVPGWLELGGVYVTAQIRGGGEKGPQWHHAGRGDRKQRSIQDLLQCARFLQQTRWCTQASLCLAGASHGGLVVAAAALQDPTVCSAVACTAPILDMTDFHRHGLGRTWLDEFGDPDDPEAHSRMLGYSPLHLLRALPAGTVLPAFLCPVFEADTRVPPAQALEFVCNLQDRGAQAWLRSEPSAGHGAKSLDRVREFSADLLAFAAENTMRNDAR